MNSQQKLVEINKQTLTDTEAQAEVKLSHDHKVSLRSGRSMLLRATIWGKLDREKWVTIQLLIIIPNK